jgi:CHAT domain-containing protein/tetratricopeptide (TPR) repeat protein
VKTKNRTSKRFIKQICLLAALLLCLQPAVHAHGLINQSQGEVKQLGPGQPLEREIAGGQTHNYQIRLAAGQFLRVVVEPKRIDLSVTLTGLGGKQAVAVDVARSGSLESLSAEAEVGGDYRLTARALGAGTLNGSYLLRLEVRAPTAEDRQRITAERLMIEAKPLVAQGSTAQRAIEKFERALALWRGLGERYFEARTLYFIGRAYSSLSQQEKAIEYLGQALAIYRELKNRQGEVGALNYLGVVNHRLSRYEKAVEYLGQALQIARDENDRADEGTVLNNLGNAYRDMSQYEKGIECYEQSLFIARQVEDRQGEASALTNLGNVYRNLNRYERAIESFEQGLLIAREVKNRLFEANTLSNLGIVYTILNRYERAIEYYEQSLVIRREVKDRTGEGISLHNIAIVYQELGQNEKAIEYYEQALVIAREVKRRVGEGNTLTNLGNVFRGVNRQEKAIEYYEQALVIAREVKNRQGEGELLNNLGIAYRGLNRHDKAVEYSEQALVIARELKERRDEAVALSSLAEAERDRGNLTRARGLIEEGLKITESLRSEIYNQESRATYFASVQGYSDFFIDLLMRLHKANPAGGFDALALEANERARARGLLELLTEAGIDIRHGVDPALLERERMLAKQLSAKAASQVQLLSRAHTPEQATALKQEISQLENDYDQVQAQVRRVSPRYAALVQPQPLKRAGIQQQLDADTLLLEYALGEDRSYLWAITKDSLTSYELPKEELIKQSALQVYELLTARSTNTRGESATQRRERVTQAEAKLPEAAQSLSQTLLAPVAEQLSNKRLVIVADGALQYIPFAMLPDPSVVGRPLSVAKNNGSRTTNRRQPLIVNHEIVSLPSASALAIQRTELAGRQPAPKMLAVIADPVFDRSDVRFTTPAAEIEKAQPQIIAFNDARSIEHLAGDASDKSDVTTMRLVIPRLPFTRQEATRLLDLTPKNSSFGAIDFQANRRTVLNGALSQYRYVHFATHGLLDTERPGLSSLVLSMVDAQGKPQDGFLRANDIYNLRLPAELVVLSACQTGLGKEIKGEGLVGLTRGFMYAGAARVVVSLWSVNDKATADLMTKFYEKMLKQGERPSAALRAAQVEMWKQKQWQSPYYWAAFTMQGEWR